MRVLFLIPLLFLASCATRPRPEPTDCKAWSGTPEEMQANIRRAELEEQEYSRRHGWIP
jgi:hypothetical protein